MLLLTFSANINENGIVDLPTNQTIMTILAMLENMNTQASPRTQSTEQATPTSRVQTDQSIEKQSSNNLTTDRTNNQSTELSQLQSSSPNPNLQSPQIPMHIPHQETPKHPATCPGESTEPHSEMQEKSATPNQYEQQRVTEKRSEMEGQKMEIPLGAETQMQLGNEGLANEKELQAPLAKGDVGPRVHPSAFNVGMVPNTQSSFFSNSQSMFQNMMLNMENQQELMGKQMDPRANQTLLKQFNANKMMYNNMSQQMGAYLQMHPMGLPSQPKMFMNTSRSGNLITQNYEESPSHFCLEHRTISNLVCLTDQKIICSNCALFGIHKGHDYIKFDNFKNDCRGKLKSIQNEFEKIRFKRFLREGDKEAHFIREKVEDKKRLLFSDLETLTAEIIKNVREQEAFIKESIDAKFEQFETVIDEWSNIQMRIKDKSENIEHRLQKLTKALSARQTDFQFLMENLYNPDTESPMGQIGKLANEIQKNEGTATAFVEKELEKYEIRTNEARVKEVVRAEAMKLFYDGAYLSQKSKALSYMNKTNEQSAGGSDEEFESEGEVEDDQKRGVDVEAGIGFDLRKSINFDINKELEANAMRANNTPVRMNYLPAVTEKESERKERMSKVRSGGPFNMLNGTPEQFEEDRSRQGQSITDNSLHHLNVSNIEKQPMMYPQVNEEELDRINVSHFTDISSGVVLDKRKSKNSYTVFDTKVDKNADHDPGLLETIEDRNLDEAFGEDFDQRSLAKGEHNILNNSIEEGENLCYDMSKGQMGQERNQMRPECDQEEEENLYRTNHYDDAEFMNEELDAEAKNQQNEFNLVGGFINSSGHRGMGAPKNSIINLNQLKGIKKQMSKYNLYDQNAMAQTGHIQLSKTRGKIHHKKTKSGLALSGTGYVSQMKAGPNKSIREKKLTHAGSMKNQDYNPKGYSRKRTYKSPYETNRVANRSRKRTKPNAIKQNLHLDLNNLPNTKQK